MSTRNILPLALAAFAVTTGCAGNPIEAPPVGDPDDDPQGGSSSGADSDGATTVDASSSPTDDPSTATTGDGNGGTGGEVDVAQVRVVHAAVGAPSVDVYLEGREVPLIADLAYGAASGYAEVEAGPVVLEIRAAGAPLEEPPAYAIALDVDAHAMVTAVAAGVLDSDDETNAFRILPLLEEFEDPGEGRTAIRFVNVGVDAGSIEIDVDEDGTTELGPVDRFADSGAPGFSVDALARLQLGLASGDGESLTAFTTPHLAEGGEVFLIATGLLERLPREPRGFSLLAVGHDGVLAMIRQNPIVYSLHASPDAGRFDLCIDDVARATGQGFGELVRMQLRPGPHELDFFPQNSGCAGEPANVQVTNVLAAGQQYLLVSAGEVVPEDGDEPFQTTAFIDAFPLDDAADAAFAVIHAGSAPTVDFGTLDDGDQVTQETLLVADLHWTEESPVVTLPPDDYACGFVPSSTPLPAAPYGIVPAPMSQGMRAWLVAAGDVWPQGYDHLATVFTVVTSTNPWTVEHL